ncbi:hypothetical protein HK405_008660 [Cladochytrium tenue]|nr:hypothetical protein HK405_008660 [Cladochytrium tenue]
MSSAAPTFVAGTHQQEHQQEQHQRQQLLQQQQPAPPPNATAAIPALSEGALIGRRLLLPDLAEVEQWARPMRVLAAYIAAFVASATTSTSNTLTASLGTTSLGGNNGSGGSPPLTPLSLRPQVRDVCAPLFATGDRRRALASSSTTPATTTARSTQWVLGPPTFFPDPRRPGSGVAALVDTFATAATASAPTPTDTRRRGAATAARHHPSLCGGSPLLASSLMPRRRQPQLSLPAPAAAEVPRRPTAPPRWCGHLPLPHLPHRMSSSAAACISDTLYPGGFKGAKLSETDEVKLFSAAAIMHAKRDIRNRTWLQGAGSMGSSSPTLKSWSLRVGLPDEANKAVLVQATEDGTFRVSVDGRTVTVDPEWTLETSLYEATVDGEPGVVVQYLDPHPLGFRLQYLGTTFDVQVRSEAQADLARHMRERHKLDLKV